MKSYEEYNKLADNGSVIKSTQVIDDYKIHSFVYNPIELTYQDYVNNDLFLESRGHSFIEDSVGNISIFTTAFRKFFNYNENPLTHESVINKLTPVNITEKLDGSLILVSRLPNGKLLCKTKSTINSEQAINATKIINNTPEYEEFCNYWISGGYTPMFEYTSPENVIVLFYGEEKLTLICLRNIETGEEIDIQTLETSLPIVKQYKTTMKNVINLQQNSTSEEGWVIKFDNGQRVKFKTLEYVRLHRVMSNIYNKKFLADTILFGSFDDILPYVNNNKNAHEYVISFKDKLINFYSSIKEQIYSFYSRNKHLDKKEYAILAKSILESRMGLAMNLYNGREDNIPEFIIKNKLYGAV